MAYIMPPPTDVDGTTITKSAAGIISVADGGIGAANLAAGIFAEAASATRQAVGSATWEDWDISSLVPANAKVAWVMIASASNVVTAGVRADGSALTRTWALAANEEVCMPVSIGAGIVEIYASTASLATFQVVGTL